MTTWYYVQDIKKEKAEKQADKLNKKFPDRSYGVGIARSNNPGMAGIYYRMKDQE